MREPLRSKPNTGDTIYYVGDGFDYLTRGIGYMVRGVDGDGDIILLDDDGDREYVGATKYGNFEIEVGDEIEDPGYFEVHTNFCEEGHDIDMVEVSVDAKGYAKLKELEAQHDKATKSSAIKAEIQRLEEELKSL